MYEPDRTLDLGDVTIALDDRGTDRTDAGAPLPLVLVHGFTGGRIDFTDVIDDLAVDRRVVAWDHRGHSESTNTGDRRTYTLEQLVADAWRVLDALGLDRFHLLGHSMGGGVVQLMVREQHERVASLVLMDTSADPMFVPREWIERYEQIGREQGMRAVADELGALGASRMVAPEQDRPAIAARNHHKLVNMDVEAYVGLAEAISTRESGLDQLKAVGCPTTVIVGELDAPFRDPSVAMAEAVEGAELVVIEGAAHCPQEEQRDEWLAAVRAHLARAEGAPTTG